MGNRTALKVSLVYPIQPTNLLSILIIPEIMEILQTGDLQRINYERTDDVQVTQLFQGIYGVGMWPSLMYLPIPSVDTKRSSKGYQLRSSGILRVAEHWMIFAIRRQACA